MAFFALLLSWVTVFAAPLSPEQKACTFKKPVVIGASISANTAMLLPGYSTAVRALALRHGVFSIGKFGVGPHRYLLSGYARNGFILTGETNYAKMFTSRDEHLGSAQALALVSGKENPVFRSASVVIGVDAFYWDAIWDNCGGGADSVENAIASLTQAAAEQGTKLILGNVPFENPDKVLINYPGLWYQPNHVCAASINETLARLCLPEKGCYVVDLLKMSERLNRGEQLSLRDGSTYGLYDMRPDGVHLGEVGSRFVAEQIVNALESNPPNCR